MRFYTATVIGAAIALAGCTGAAEETAAAPECDYQCTVDTHLTAIQEHDWDSFAATLTAQPQLQLILPDGRLIEGREAYMEILEPWLSGGGFTFEHETVDQRVGADMGYTLLRMRQQNDGEEDVSNFFLLLVFAIEDGEWRLVHDQNTGISDEVLAEAENPET